MAFVSVHSPSDGIEDWQPAWTRAAEHIEVDSGHCGMAVNPEVYRVLAPRLSRPDSQPSGAGPPNARLPEHQLTIGKLSRS